MHNLALQLLAPEIAHRVAVGFLRQIGGLHKFKQSRVSSGVLKQTQFGLRFDNPLGMAAGFDKDAYAYPGLFYFGLGAVEVGTVLCRAHNGNNGKRSYRLKEDKAVINRYGLPSEGMDKVSQRLQKRKRGKQRHVLGVNIGSHPESKDVFADYHLLAKQFASCADYLTLNVSCPNVTTHANFQSPEFLPKILDSVQKGLQESGYTRPYLLKLSPDLETEDLRKIVDIAFEYQVSGLIMGNTTTSRPKDLQSKHKNEIGGLSGKPLFSLSTAKLAELYVLCEGKLPLIGVGGIDSADSAYAKIKAGASLLQIYTGLIYNPSLVKEITKGLPSALKHDGFSHISEAVGCEAAEYAALKS